MIIRNRKSAGRLLWLWLWLGLLLPWGVAAGQEADPFAAEKARIREIKLGGEHYYADVSSEDAEDALLMARRLLALEIQGQETGCEKVGDLLLDSCRYIRLKRVDRPRIFAYIAKETVAVWLEGGTGQPAGVPDKAEVAADTAGRKVAADTVGGGSAGQTVAADTAGSDPADRAVVVRPDTLTVTVRDTVRVVVRDTVSLTVTDTVRTRLELRTTGNDRLDRILKLKTIAEVQPFFIAEKKAGRMMFGKLSSATRPGECYLLFFNREGKVVAVLDKGEHTRLNLLTGKSDSAGRYREGCGAIWFLLYE